MDSVGTNADRITRLFARFVGVGYLAFFLMQVGAISAMADKTASWWTPLAIAAAYIAGMLPGIVSFWAGPSTMRLTAIAAAVGYLIAVATWFVAWDGTVMAPEERVWFTSFTGLAAISVVVAGWLWWAFGYLAVAGVAVQIVKLVSRDETGPIPFVPELCHTMIYNTVFMVAVAMALRTGNILDRTEASTQAAAASEAAQQARAAEREKFDALTHDAVMSALLTAARSGSQDQIRRQASATLAELDRLKTVVPIERVFSGAAVVASLRTTVLDAGGDVEFATDGDVDRLEVPGEVVAAVNDALAEALRNSVRHAGPAVRSVLVECRRGRIAVTVHDDGLGFDPAAVDERRLGIAVSIIGRIERLDRGSATVDSTPGAGTTVTLRWEKP